MSRLMRINTYIYICMYVCICVYYKRKFICLTRPAAGVMQTRPVIMPCVAPITEGFSKKIMSSKSHVSRLVAVHTWVLRTARDASALTEKGSPPLNPVHPIQSRPAPASISRMLFGGNLCLSLLALGPTCTPVFAPTNYQS